MISKSKIMASLQCSKKLWLLVNKPDVSNAKDSMEFARARGNELGELARVLYSANEQGTLVNPSISGFVDACQQTKALMKGVSPIFEATFISNDELAMADIMVSDKVSGGWQMIEVKSASNPKSHYIDDLSIQVRIAEKSGANITKASIAYINSSFVYGGDGNYQGLLNEVDIPLNTLASKDTVNRWIDNAAAIIATDAEPSCNTGLHCSSPYECEFRSYCSSMEVQVSNPVSWLPNVRSKALKQFIATGARDMSEIPDSLLNAQQSRVKQYTLSGETFFDREGAAMDLDRYPLPVKFLDFETVQFVIPIWKGTRPFQQIVFQASIDAIDENGVLSNDMFLAVDGDDNSRKVADFLVKHCGTEGAIFVYFATFEKSRIAELAGMYPDLAYRLLAISERVTDLLPIARERYYHRSQQGSWSIKKVIESIAPDLSYERLSGVKDGSMAMEAFRQIIDNRTDIETKERLKGELLDYCRTDTLGLVRMWQLFSGQT